MFLFKANVLTLYNCSCSLHTNAFLFVKKDAEDLQICILLIPIKDQAIVKLILAS